MSHDLEIYAMGTITGYCVHYIITWVRACGGVK